MALSTNMREIRKSKGVTSSAIASILGITPGAYNHFEKQRNPVPDEAVPVIAEYLGVPEYIMRDDQATAEYVKSFKERIQWVKAMNFSKKNSQKAL